MTTRRTSLRKSNSVVIESMNDSSCSNAAPSSAAASASSSSPTSFPTRTSSAAVKQQAAATLEQLATGRSSNGDYDMATPATRRSSRARAPKVDPMKLSSAEPNSSSARTVESEVDGPVPMEVDGEEKKEDTIQPGVDSAKQPVKQPKKLTPRHRSTTRQTSVAIETTEPEVQPHSTSTGDETPIAPSSSAGTLSSAESLRRTSRQRANPRLVVRSYAELEEPEMEDELPSNPASEEPDTEDAAASSSAAPPPTRKSRQSKQKSQLEDEEESKSFAEDSQDPHVDRDNDDEEEEYKDDAAANDASESGSDAKSDADDDDADDDFSLSPVRKKKRKSGSGRKSKEAPKNTRPKKKHKGDSDVVVLDDEDENMAAATTRFSDTDGNLSEVRPSLTKKLTAAQRRKQSSTPEEPTPSQERRDAAFRAFAAAPVSIKKSNAAAAPPPTRSHAVNPTTSTSKSAAAKENASKSVEREVVCIDDDDDDDMGAHVNTTNNSASWNSLGLGASTSTSTPKASTTPKPPSTSTPSAHAPKPLTKFSKTSVPMSEKETKISALHEFLGSSSAVSRAELVRYLEGADWNVETAAGRIVDSAWFQSAQRNNDSSFSSPTAPPPKSRTPTPAPAPPRSSIVIDDSPTDASSSTPRSTSTFRKATSFTRTAAAKSTSSPTPPPSSDAAAAAAAAAASPPSDPYTVEFADVPTAPPKALPSWDRKLLLILNVNALSTTSGKNILCVGDPLEFRREKFDPLGWSQEQKEKADSDATANAKAMHAASGSSTTAGGGKKPALSKAKSKASASTPLLKKKAPRILRFAKKGSAANTLEIGSVPAVLTELLAPLFDAGFVELVSEVLYVPAVLDYYTTINISLSVFVLPPLFVWTPPRELVQQVGKDSENPFWKRVFAKKESEAAKNSTSSGIWNPIQAFCKLLRECEVAPLASTEMELDLEAKNKAASTEATNVEKAERVEDIAHEELSQPLYDEEIVDDAANATATSTTAAASSSSSSGGAAKPVALAADNTEGATISRFQLDALYAGANSASLTLPEADTPPNIRATLRHYQRQALHWMKQRESPNDSNSSAASGSPTEQSGGKPPRRHPLWDEYAFSDPDETRFYVNSFSNEISLEFPASTGSVRGGVLADEQGLGKTLMSISLIVANHPANVYLDEVELEKAKRCIEEETENKENEEADEMDTSTAAAAAAASSSSASLYSSLLPSRRSHRRQYMHHEGVSGCTLVVCPMSLLSQWRDEISRFSDLDTLVYYGSSKDRRKVDFEEYDVILTSYGTIAAEHRAVTQEQKALAASMANGNTIPSALPALPPKQLAALSPIYSTRFFRIMLDEGHIIRNRQTETAQAIFALQGERRWSLSGTIIQNRIDDVFSCLHFLREQPWSDWNWWNKVISTPFERQDPVALGRLKAILTPLMLRRTKSMRMANGERIVDLPERHDETIMVQFSDQEREFYNALFTRSKLQFEGFVSAGVVSNKYIEILTLLLRLRQCCDHPFLVLNAKSKSDKDFEADIQRFIHRFASRIDLGKEGAPSMQFLESLTQQLKQNKPKESGGDATSTEVPNQLECPICLCEMEVPVLTECAHMACRECLGPLFNERGFARCPLCRSIIQREKLFLVPEAETLQVDPKTNWRHSSKTAVLLKELKAIRDGPDPNAKVIIFSQWTSMLDLIETAFDKEPEKHKLKSLRLDGSLSQKERENVLQKFKADASIPILLLSLKAGGVGLNLVAANYCYLVDSWWNLAVEEQAVQRIHRIGQTKPVYVKRFMVEGTIEKRILELQEKKKFLAQSLMSDEEEKKNVRMEDLVSLFQDAGPD